MVRITVVSSLLVLQTLFSAPIASAQNTRDIIDLFGGIMRSTIFQVEWRKLPPAEVACVDQALRNRGGSLQRAIEEGIAPSDMRISDVRSMCRTQFTQRAPQPVQTARQKSVYAVEGLSLGSRVRFDSADYREYKCDPSKQFDGFTWCSKTRNDRERRGSFTASYSILHSPEGSAFYINRYQEPAFWAPTEANDDIERLSGKFGEQPRITRMPSRPGLPNGMIAQWGRVILVPLVDRESIQTLVEGKSPKVGILVDFIGNFGRSARLGLPIYSVSGGAGFVWVASYDQKGRGILRFFAVDASAYSGAPAPPSKPPEAGPTAPSPTEVIQATRRRAVKGDPIAQFELGMMYANGQALAKDDVLAAAWFRKAADQGNANAQHRLGVMYDTGQGVDKDGSQAVSWYRKAAVNGHHEAKTRLDEAVSIIQRLHSTITMIQDQLIAGLNIDVRKQAEEIAARLATANEELPLADLQALRAEADSAVRILDETKKFRAVSETANQKVIAIERELEQITSDHPIVLKIRTAIETVKAAQTEPNLRSLQDALRNLNKLYDDNQKQLRDWQFHPY
jgi:TPR repeat protein